MGEEDARVWDVLDEIRAVQAAHGRDLGRISGDLRESKALQRAMKEFLEYKVAQVEVEVRDAARAATGVKERADKAEGAFRAALWFAGGGAGSVGAAIGFMLRGWLPM